MKAGRPSKEVKNTLSLSDVTNQPTKTTRVNFNLEEDKYVALKKYALNNRQTITQVLTEMVDKVTTQR